MSDFEAFYYDHQLLRYVVQFMAIFSNMKVKVGASATLPPRLIKVPIIYGSRDRVVAAIKGDNTQNKPLRVPTMSAIIKNIEMAPDLRKGIGQVRRKTVMPLGQPFPEGVQVIKQMMPVPYRAKMDLTLYASNTDQHFQLMEQILMLFDPIVQIQIGDDPFDWAILSTVELKNITWEEAFPSLADKRIIQSTLNFDLPIYLSPPAEFKKNYIADIRVRLGVVPTTTNLRDSQDVIQALDDEGVIYEDLFTLSDINIEKSPNA